MRRLITISVWVATLGAAVAFPQAGLLPDSFGPWEARGPVHAFAHGEGVTTDPAAGATLAILNESGLRRIEQRDYSRGPDILSLRVSALHDPSSAYEYYTYLLTPGMLNPGLGEDSAQQGSEVVFLTGNLVVQARLSPNSSPEEFKDLLPLLKSKADATPLPPLKSYLPLKWRVFGSEKYALGPQAFREALNGLNQGTYASLSREVGFQNGAEAMLARYQGEKGGGVLLLLEYPTPQLAENHLHHLQDALTAEAKRSGVSVERKASLLSLVFAPSSPAHAQAIRDEVNYETEVTWNEPSQTATDPPLVYIMFKIFLFTSLFMVLAVLIGIAFGAVRVLVKRLLPGKVFDRPHDMEVIQLGLSGKKIDPTDMY